MRLWRFDMSARGTRLIFTVAITSDDMPWLEECYSVCHDTITRYARRIGADFFALTQRRLESLSPFPHVEKFNVKDWLDAYDQVLFIDSDVFIKPAAADIFAACPDRDAIAILDQVDHLDGFPDVREWHDQCHAFLRQKRPTMPRVYFNTGVMMLSSRHRELFDTSHYFDGPAWEQEFLITRLFDTGVSIAKLPVEFNTFFNYSSDEDKRRAHFLHLGQAAKVYAKPLQRHYYE